MTMGKKFIEIDRLYLLGLAYMRQFYMEENPIYKQKSLQQLSKAHQLCLSLCVSHCDDLNTVDKSKDYIKKISSVWSV